MRVLITLSSLSEAYPGQLARAAGTSATRLRWLMHGHLPQYRPELSLLRLGLAAEEQTPSGRVYRITTRGRRKARSLAARWSRQGGRGPRT